VSIAAYNNDTQRQNIFSQTDFTVTRVTGNILHTIVSGVELGRQLTDNFRETGYFTSLGANVTSVSVPVISPTTTLPVTFRQAATDADNRSVARVGSLFVQDQIAFGTHLQVIAGFMGSREPLRVLADINLDECTVDERGWIDIVLSADRPADHDGDWFPLDATLPDTFVVARQISYDWLSESEATLAIERIDRPVPSRAHTVGPLESLPLVADYVRKEPIRFMEVQEKHLALLEPNALMEVSRELPGAMAGQTYMHGLIQIAPDEALIIEFEPPVDSPYWGVQILDYFYNTLDVRRMPASLNGHQGATDPDGKVRIVVAASDPGVRNWLDKGHDERVQLRMRFYAAKRPTITTSVVPLDMLLDHLPPETATVTPAERAQTLRDRVIGLQLRRRW